MGVGVGVGGELGWSRESGGGEGGGAFQSTSQAVAGQSPVRSTWLYVFALTIVVDV